MIYNYSQNDLMRMTDELRRAYEGFADSVRIAVTKGVEWDDETARELIDSISAEADKIKESQTDYLVRGSYGIFDSVLDEEFCAYLETVKIISEGV